MNKKLRKYERRQNYRKDIGISYETLLAAKQGNVEAIMLIQKHYDPYMRRLATEEINGTRYLNVDLYDSLKTKLIVTIPLFKSKYLP